MKPFFPWRYISPRRGYYSELKVAKACPEIRHLIDKAAFYKICERITMIPLVVIFVVVLPLVYIIDFGKRMLKHLPPLLPDFSNRRRLIIDEIHKTVPLEEMRQRAGLEPLPQILPKRDGLTSNVDQPRILTTVEERSL